MEDELYISRQDTEEILYRQLQEKSLQRLQAAAGKVWTDFNPHDPGVTICDIVNDALTEVDYRLHFPLEDYLAEENGGFEPERFGLFSPLRVFPVTPVTSVDYRKLLIDSIDKLENIWIYPSAAQGWYEALAELSPLASEYDREEVRKQIIKIFESHRNLCEGLGKVNFIHRKPLQLTGDIELSAGADALEVLTEIYLETLHFFTGNVRYLGAGEVGRKEKSVDEWLDGPALKYWTIDTDSLQPLPVRYSIAVLFRRLMTLKGIETVRSLAFKDGPERCPDIIPTDDPANSYTVEIPDNGEKLGIMLWAGGSPVKVDISIFYSLFYASYARHYGRQNCIEDLSSFRFLPESNYRAIYQHVSVQNDFPECYGINHWGVASGETPERKAQAKQLKAYMLLYDEIFARGLKELQDLPALMAMDWHLIKEGPVKTEVPGDIWELLTDAAKLHEQEGDKKRFFRQKEQLLEMWSGMYGENSDPGWLKEYNYYEETETDKLARRFGFLQRIPEWGHNRCRAVDLSNINPENVPGIKAYVGSLLGWEMTVEKPVVNVFPMYNLRLVDDDYFYNRPVGILSHDLIAENILKPEYMEAVNMPEKDYTGADYSVLKEKLSLLHYNLLFEGLFREGIIPENYHVLNVPGYLNRLLIFHHTQRNEWINLGRFESKEELEDIAGCLRHFLMMLNRKSESLYVVEHLFLEDKGEKKNFDITVVFPGWSARMTDERFRRECEKLVCGRLPAHLLVEFQWRNMVQMWQFERAYYDWRKALADGESADKEGKRLKNILSEGKNTTVTGQK